MIGADALRGQFQRRALIGGNLRRIAASISD
jgi:hypothetical protein